MDFQKERNTATLNLVNMYDKLDRGTRVSLGFRIKRFKIKFPNDYANNVLSNLLDLKRKSLQKKACIQRYALVRYNSVKYLHMSKKQILRSVEK